MMDWIESLRTNFLKKPGSHLSVIGVSGYGKTTCLTWLVEGLVRFSPSETIVWFDSGKSDELLILGKYRPLHLIIPATMGVDIELFEGVDIDIRYTYVQRPEDVWDHLIRSRINIIVLEPFTLDPTLYTPIVIKVFTRLIKRANKKDLPEKMALFCDEFNKICPSDKHAHGKEHGKLAYKLAWNVERLRSMGIRFVVSQQGYTSVLKTARQHFLWRIAKCGCEFQSGRLSKYNSIWNGLSPEKAVIVYPNGVYSDIVTIPWPGKGSDLGSVRYNGELLSYKDPEFDPELGFISLEEFLGLPLPADETEEEEEDSEPEENPGISLSLLDEKMKDQLYILGTAAGLSGDRDEVIREYLEAANV